MKCWDLLKLASIFSGEGRVLNSELWHACAGPLVSLPAVGSRVVYFPQGHSEQVSHKPMSTILLHKLNVETDPLLMWNFFAYCFNNHFMFVSSELP